MKDKKTVVLIPSYEPDPRLVQLSEIISSRGYDVLIVNDGSSSKFNKIFEACRPYASLEGYKINYGKGHALKYGFSIIKEDFPDAEFIITCDGDGQHSPRDIDRIYDELVTTKQLVFGVRYFDKNVPMRSRFGNAVSRVIRNTLTKQYIPDDQCGLRGFPIRYLSDLISLEGSRYEYEMNQLVVFQLKRYAIIPLPIEVIYENGNPTSHFKVIKDTGRIHHAIFKHAWIPLSLILTSLGAMYLMLIPNNNGICIPAVWIYIFSTFPMFFFSLGLQSLIYQTNKFPKRLLLEFVYFSIKVFIGLCLLILFTELLCLNIFISLALALFISNLIVNLGFVTLYGKVKAPGRIVK